MSGHKLSVAQVAELFGVTRRTVQRWSDDGALPSTRTIGGARRFDQAAVEKAMREA